MKKSHGFGGKHPGGHGGNRPPEGRPDRGKPQRPHFGDRTGPARGTPPHREGEPHRNHSRGQAKEQQGHRSRHGGGRPPQADERVHWLWGQHPVEAALNNKARHCHKLLATVRGAERMAVIAQTRGVRLEITDDERLDRMLPKGAVHQGVALEVDPLPRIALEDVLEKNRSPRLFVMLDQVNDPHNLGAVLRTAAAFGAQGVIVQERHSPPLSGVTAKSASGALEKIPVIEVVNLSRTLDELGREGFVRLGFDEDGAFSIDAQNLDADTVLVFGAEGEGLRRLTRENCDHLVRLPTSAAFSSLNVSNAVAIALYETVRQRNARKV
ncbi:MAG TPA: 23S rRNA (guanosine(2251)-2'-O)-methyltransferase RlmB [Micropepsaceae bacterium]|nr:23S rRNA (guanosine(2251)-2'-O)-methyltransferase RlmB [Micropepsaceae bacterium]